MRLNYVHLKNYRNFTDCKLIFNEKTLIIGANDIGKTNILSALRMLLDKSIPESALEPKDEDFCAYCETSEENEYSILLYFTDANEDCIRSGFKEFISQNNEVYIKYRASRNSVGGKKDYEILVGPSLDLLEAVSTRFYLRVLNMRYIGATRQIDKYLKTQKTKLLEYLKESRTQDERESDEEKFKLLSTGVKEIEKDLNTLTFISRAGTKLNTHLKELSEHHQQQNLSLGVDLPSNEDLFNKINLLSTIHESNIHIGGEGRKNQAFIALWSALNVISIEDGHPEEISIFCIEEPEAHLHPHQQRKLAEYLVNNLKAQVLLSSHSPFIACEFQSDSIVRLHLDSNFKTTTCSQQGVSEVVSQTINSLEYRLDALVSEVYFSDCVFLVEGTSEVLFYKHLALELNIDLDRLNISILSVEGVGFNKYIDLLNALGIPWVMRTDNDYQKYHRKSKELKEAYYLQGIRRLINIYKENRTSTVIPGQEKDLTSIIEENTDNLTENANACESRRKEMYDIFYPHLSRYGLFVSKIGLEEDIFNSCNEVRTALENYFSPPEDGEDERKILTDVISEMKKKKSTFMYFFTTEHKNVLKWLKTDPLADPLHSCVSIIKIIRGIKSEKNPAHS